MTAIGKKTSLCIYEKFKSANNANNMQKYIKYATVSYLEDNVESSKTSFYFDFILLFVFIEM